MNSVILNVMCLCNMIEFEQTMRKHKEYCISTPQNVDFKTHNQWDINIRVFQNSSYIEIVKSLWYNALCSFL